MGWHSYEIYLFHIVVLGLMRNVYTKATLGYWQRLPWFGLFLVATGLVAMLISRFVAEPANTAIRRYYAIRMAG
jgi:peptidoglycan/LPS O-acetylase OafA/YrhL